MQISIIVATAQGNAIGRKGDLLFHISADLRRFKEITMGHPIIMGRKTFESFPKGPLPGRQNIVITRQSDYHHDGITVVGLTDLGIVGKNEFAERQEQADIIRHLGFSRCRMSLAIPKAVKYTGLSWFEGKKIATSYPNILRRFLPFIP